MADLRLTIETSSQIFEPSVVDGISLQQERQGSPSKLTFKVLKEGTMPFNEGDRVCFWYGTTPMFMGYVFKKQRDKEGQITVTAYDQLRYLKNKFTYVFTKKKASDIISMVAADFGLQVGAVEDTGYTIPSLIEENKTLFDIILDSLEETTANTGKLYIMYDNFGSIELKSLDNMLTNVLIDDETAENFNYSSSIDDETYNRIVLYYVDENNTIIPYTASDPSMIEQWGLLQYFEEVKVQSIAQSKAEALLSIYNKKTRELTINNAFGNTAVRAGSLIVVKLNLGDIVVSNYMLIDKVVHNFKNDYYTMEITLNGSWGD